MLPINCCMCGCSSLFLMLPSRDPIAPLALPGNRSDWTGGTYSIESVLHESLMLR